MVSGEFGWGVAISIQSAPEHNKGGILGEFKDDPCHCLSVCVCLCILAFSPLPEARELGNSTQSADMGAQCVANTYFFSITDLCCKV